MSDVELLDSLLPLTSDPPALGSACRAVVRSWTALADKAEWAYCVAQSDRVSAGRRVPPAQFTLEWLEAWAECLANTALVIAGGRIECGLSDRVRRTVLLFWHFPEYPLVVPAVGEAGAVVLVAGGDAWIGRVLGPSQRVNFRQPGGVDQVVELFEHGEPVATMIDYCYEETSSVAVPFLGRPARTPTGVFALARRYGYEIEVHTVRQNACVRADRFQAEGEIAELAARVNDTITHEIEDDPSRWLLWPSLDRRWPDACARDPKGR